MELEYRMLRRLVQLKNPIRLYLEDTLGDEKTKLDLTDQEWFMAKSLLDLLEAVDEVTTTLCGEKYSTIFTTSVQIAGSG